MNKKKVLITICSVMVVIIAVVVIIALNNNGEKDLPQKSLKGVKADFEDNIQYLKDGNFDNLIYNDFEASIDDVEGVYNIEIKTDNSYKDRTFLENFELMNKAVDRFFLEDFDKSYINAEFIRQNENEEWEHEYVNYYDIEKVCVGEKYNAPRGDYMYGGAIKNGEYFVQTSESRQNTWFSRGEFGTVHSDLYTKTYPYVTCIRQADDVKLNLKDGEIMLSEMEKKVLNFVNGDFSLSVSDNITMGIGEVRILENGDCDGVAFKIRRIYKGIPFEYGSIDLNGIYMSNVDCDAGEIQYASSKYPDTMLAFGRVNGTVVETEEITEILTLKTALTNLSEKIGDNSVYDVYGVELVYRASKIPEEREEELDDILTPKWKIITINQNDSKYTLFYVDVVTGEITQRFEYYYE